MNDKSYHSEFLSVCSLETTYSFVCTQPEILSATISLKLFDRVKILVLGHATGKKFLQHQKFVAMTFMCPSKK